MTRRSLRRIFFFALSALVVASAFLLTQLPRLAANALLHPVRHHVQASPPEHCENSEFAGDGVRLQGWKCRSLIPSRGTVIYLHGVASNRTSAFGVIPRFVNRGFDVVAYDARAHGESEGDISTYGYFEKRDLHRVIDSLPRESVVLFGSSMGAAVALQEAADDDRVVAVIAAESFSDLRTVAIERAPFFLTTTLMQRAFELAERDGGFKINDVDVAAVASRVMVPVLLIHGDIDRDTPPAHSQRIFSALPGAKRLILVPGARHNESLSGAVWTDIERWLDEVVH
jgi:pimeloyl-ACP methyl ester carboxylesterase